MPNNLLFRFLPARTSEWHKGPFGMEGAPRQILFFISYRTRVCFLLTFLHLKWPCHAYNIDKMNFSRGKGDENLGPGGKNLAVLCLPFETLMIFSYFQLFVWCQGYFALILHDETLFTCSFFLLGHKFRPTKKDWPDRKNGCWNLDLHSMFVQYCLIST